MSGHSKWATTKRHKAAIDAKRGKIFSMLSKELSMVARTGGGDPEFNPRLRQLVAKAKAANMPADNVERAIKKGTGELPGMSIEEITYEGYAPGGVGVILEVTTDNKNRSASEVRSTFTKHGGNLAQSGAVSFQFERKGQFLVEGHAIEEARIEELAIEAGAEDVKNHGDHYELVCAIEDFDTLGSALEKAGVQPAESELVYLPTVLCPITDADTARKVLRMIEALDDLEDTKAVHSNYDIDASLLDSASA